MRGEMKEDFDFEIFPYVGAGPITFGMSPERVESILGLPELVERNHLNQRVEHRAFMNVGYSNDGGLALNHIGFGRQMIGVRYGDLKIFVDDVDLVVQALCTDDGAPGVYLGFLVLANLGLALTGFHDNDRSQLAITLFPKGAWDNRLSKVRPFTL